MGIKSSISRNAILNGIKTLLQVVFPLITFPYAAKVLGVEQIGEYNFAYSIVSYFMLLASLGIYNYAVREGAALRSNREKISKFASQILEFNIISMIISYFILISLCLFWKALFDYSSLIMIISSNIVLTTFGCEWIYAIYEEYFYITIRGIVFQLLSMFVLFTCVHSSKDLVMYAISALISSSGYNILNIIGLRNKFDFKIQPLKLLKRHFIPIMLLFANSIATTIYVNSDTTILGLLTGNRSVGLYSVATKVYSIIKAVLASIIIVSIPQMSNFWALNKRNEFENLGNRILNSFLTIALPSMIGIYVLSDDIIRLIADETYLEASVALRILSIALLISVFNWFFQSSILIPSKNEKYVLYASCVAALLNVLLNFIFIPKFYQSGAAFTTLLAEGVSVIISGYSAKKIIRIRIKIRDVISLLLGCIFIVFYSNIIKIVLNKLFWRVGITIVGSCIGYFAILFLLKNTVIIDGIKKIRKS